VGVAAPNKWQWRKKPSLRYKSRHTRS
jgi:hypothetical protein